MAFDGFNNSIEIDFNDITMKTELIVRNDFIALKFDEKSFFSTILGFNSHWNYKHVYNSNVNWSKWYTSLVNGMVV